MTDARVHCSTVVFFSGVVNVTVKKRLKRALHVTFSLFNYFLQCFALFLIAFIMVYCCRQLPQVYFHLWHSDDVKFMCGFRRHYNYYLRVISSWKFRDIEIWLGDHSRLLKLARFESLGSVSYSPSIVTIYTVVSVAICEIFSVKEWCDLENRVRVRSRSLEMVPWHFRDLETWENFDFYRAYLPIFGVPLYLWIGRNYRLKIW